MQVASCKRNETKQQPKLQKLSSQSQGTAAEKRVPNWSCTKKGNTTHTRISFDPAVEVAPISFHPFFPLTRGKQQENQKSERVKKVLK